MASRAALTVATLLGWISDCRRALLQTCLDQSPRSTHCLDREFVAMWRRFVVRANAGRTRAAASAMRSSSRTWAVWNGKPRRPLPAGSQSEV